MQGARLGILQNKDLETRHKADKELVERAWERVKASDSSFGEKAAAYLVTNAMKAKLAMGAGVKNKGRRIKRGRINKKTVKGRGRQRKIPGVRVIPLPKRGGILQYLIPLLTGLSNIGSFAGTANDLLKTVQKMKGSGL